MPRTRRPDYTSPDLAHALALFFAGECAEGMPRSRWEPYIVLTKPRDKAPVNADRAKEHGLTYDPSVGGCWAPECDMPAAVRTSNRHPHYDFVAEIRDDLGHLYCSTECRQKVTDIRTRALAAFRAWCVTDLPAEAFRAHDEAATLRMALRFEQDERETAEGLFHRTATELRAARADLQALEAEVERLTALVASTATESATEAAAEVV